MTFCGKSRMGGIHINPRAKGDIVPGMPVSPAIDTFIMDAVKEVRESHVQDLSKGHNFRLYTCLDLNLEPFDLLSGGLTCNLKPNNASTLIAPNRKSHLLCMMFWNNSISCYGLKYSQISKLSICSEINPSQKQLSLIQSIVRTSCHHFPLVDLEHCLHSIYLQELSAFFAKMSVHFTGSVPYRVSKLCKTAWHLCYCGIITVV